MSSGCSIPGVEGTDWQGGHYRLIMQFDDPDSPVHGELWDGSIVPRCAFDPPISHVNIFPSGTISLDMQGETIDAPDSTEDGCVAVILRAIQHVLAVPDMDSPSSEPMWTLIRKDPHAYQAVIRDQAKRFGGRDSALASCGAAVLPVEAGLEASAGAGVLRTSERQAQGATAAASKRGPGPQGATA